MQGLSIAVFFYFLLFHDLERSKFDDVKTKEFDQKIDATLMSQW